MASLADLPELVGFFSYSREDDEDSQGALSALRDRIQRELRGQLGRSTRTFRLWQDKEAIPSGALWETEIKNAVAQSAFFIPIITPTVVQSHYCRFELEAFLEREAGLDRSDLVFPILYIRVPGLEDEARQKSDPVLSIVAKRQYLDWREFRHHDVNSREVRETIERFCRNICDALFRSWLSPEERKQLEEAAARERAEAERARLEAEARGREEEERNRAEVLALARTEEEKRQRTADAERQKAEAKAKRRAESEARRLEEQRVRDEAKTKRAAEGEGRSHLAWKPIAGVSLSLGILAALGWWINDAIISQPRDSSPQKSASSTSAYTGSIRFNGVYRNLSTSLQFFPDGTVAVDNYSARVRFSVSGNVIQFSTSSRNYNGDILKDGLLLSLHIDGGAMTFYYDFTSR